MRIQSFKFVDKPNIWYLTKMSQGQVENLFHQRVLRNKYQFILLINIKVFYPILARFINPFVDFMFGGVCACACISCQSIAKSQLLDLRWNLSQNILGPQVGMGSGRNRQLAWPEAWTTWNWSLEVTQTWSVTAHVYKWIRAGGSFEFWVTWMGKQKSKSIILCCPNRDLKMPPMSHLDEGTWNGRPNNEEWNL